MPPLPAVMLPICSVVAPEMATADAVVSVVVSVPASETGAVPPWIESVPPLALTVPPDCVTPAPCSDTPVPETPLAPSASAAPAVVIDVRPLPPVTAPVRFSPPAESFRVKVVLALPRNRLFTRLPTALRVTAPLNDCALSSLTSIEVLPVWTTPFAPDSTTRALPVLAVMLPVVSVPPVPAVSVTAEVVALVVVSAPARFTLPAEATSEIVPAPESIVPPAVCDIPPVVAVAETFPPLVVMLPPAPKLTLPSGEVRLTPNAPVVLVIALLTYTLPVPPPAPALSVSEVDAPKVLSIGALTVMSPAVLVPVAFAVVITTAVPPLSTALMSVFRIFEVSVTPVGVKTPPMEPVLLVVAPAVMVTSVSGSKSQRPALPLGALAPPRTPVASRM